MGFWELLAESWREITAVVAAVDGVIVPLTIAWILSIKKESTSAVAWCLCVILLPLFGPLLFVVFGYQNVHRPLTKKRRHKRTYRLSNPRLAEGADGPRDADPPPPWRGMARLAERLDAFPLRPGNRVTFYPDGPPAYRDKLDAIRAAKHHVHLEYFIFQTDASGRQFMELLAEKARQGVEVRLLYDAMGSYRLSGRLLRSLVQAGGKFDAFFPLNPWRRRIQVNLRNHRKILVVDGRVAFSGGLNIGDEYLGKSAYFGYWRDQHLKVEGPAVADLQRIFVEDWDFAFGESLKGGVYFPDLSAAGESPVQVVQSGPDQELRSIREVYFAAILRARKRLWIASPYFVPDAGLRDALILAGHYGIDVRLLCQYKPDKWLPYYAARYYFTDVLEAGVKVYQYTKGMMHSKLMMVDGQWASVGTANLDNRSLHLNFEVNCLIYDPAKVAELEEQFRRDLDDSVRLDKKVYARRPLAGRLVENGCRLLSPVL